MAVQEHAVTGVPADRRVVTLTHITRGFVHGNAKPRAVIAITLHTMTPGRRQLCFDSLNGIMPDVTTLLRGHRTVGRWTLAQILNHLVMSFEFSMTGFPTGRFPWVVRQTLGRLVIMHLFSTEKIIEGVKLPKHILPPPNLDPHAEAGRLSEIIDRFKHRFAQPQDLAIHPFMGRLAQRWERYHCIHCAHHLSFAIAQAPPSA